VDVFLPVTATGRAHALAASAVLGLKRRIKKNPQAMALVSRLRRLKAAVTG
jgi:CelD/BcsL family acetyltransferase involved in cellulose biosynthesis